MFLSSIRSKVTNLAINITLACCSTVLTTLLYKYFRRERNEVIFFYGPQNKICDSHNGIIPNVYTNIDCSICKLQKIIEWINESKKTLDVCIYMISEHKLINAVIDAHKRGVNVRIIVNEDNVHSTWKLGMAGVAKRVKPWEKTDNLMHHKFIIIDKKKVILGSLNWTSSGIRKNFENIFITNQHHLVKPFNEEFKRLWKKFSSMK